MKKKFTFEGQAKSVVDDAGIGVVGVWTDGIGIYADNDQGAAYKLEPAKKYKVTIEVIEETPKETKYLLLGSDAVNTYNNFGFEDLISVLKDPEYPCNFDLMEISTSISPLDVALRVVGWLEAVEVTKEEYTQIKALTK